MINLSDIEIQIAPSVNSNENSNQYIIIERLQGNIEDEGYSVKDFEYINSLPLNVETI